jgi:hypothetical protein
LRAATEAKKTVTTNTASQRASAQASPVHCAAKRLRTDNVELVARLKQAMLRGQSERSFAAEAKIPRTSLQHLREVHEALLDTPEIPPGLVAFLETPSGVLWLHRVALALLMVVVLCAAGGLRHVQLILKLTLLDKFLPCSLSALARRCRQLEAETVTFAKEQTATLAANMPRRSISVALDETFHPKGMLLVALDPASNFIIVQCYADKRDCEAWLANLTGPLQDLNVDVLRTVSDEAGAIRKFVTVELGVFAGVDLFHVQYEMSRGVGFPMKQLEQRAERLLAKATEELESLKQKKLEADSTPRRPGHPLDWNRRVQEASEKVCEVKESLVQAQTQRQEMREHVRGLSAEHHPFDLKTGEVRSGEQVKAAELKHVHDAMELASKVGLPEFSFKALSKTERSVEKLCQEVTFFHLVVQSLSAALSVSDALRALLTGLVLPYVYLGLVLLKTSNKELRATLVATRQTLWERINNEPEWLALSEPERRRALTMAQEWAQWFQRASSGVEGHNGHLRVRQHHLHFIRPLRLAALKAIHNFMLERPDGTTAAERFFGRPPDNLFESLLKRLPLPGRPRAPRRSKATPAMV